MTHTIFPGLSHTMQKASIKVHVNHSIDDVIDIVCSTLKIDREGLEGESRKRKYMEARQILSKILYDRGATLVKIAKKLNRHHASIINSKDNCYAFIDADKDFSNRFNRCLDAL